MHARYFIGNDVHTNKIEPLPCASFSDLTRQVYLTPRKLDLTQKHFLKLPKRQRDRLKSGPYLMASTFKRNIRSTENAKACNIILLDLEGNPVRLAEIAGNPQPEAEALAPYAYLIHHTATSSPAAPRLRVVIAADNLPPSLYRPALRHFAKLLRVEFDPISQSHVVPMFLPVRFERGPHPVISWDDGGEFKARDLPAEAQADPESDPAGPDLESAIPPEDLPASEVAAILGHLPDAGAYHAWLEAGMALHHQFRGGDDGFQLWDEWSQSAPNYDGQRSLARKWEGFGHRGGPPVTIATLIKRAQANGYDATRLKDTTYSRLRDWIVATGRTEDDYRTKAVARIADAPLDKLSTAALTEELVAAWKGKFPQGAPGKRVILAAIKEIEDKRKAAVKIAATESPRWLEGWCYVRNRKLFINTHTKEVLDTAAFNNAMGIHLPKNELGRPEVDAQDYAINEAQVKQVARFEFRPDVDEDFFVSEEDGLDCVNSYRPSPTLPSERTSEKAAEAVTGHLQNLVAEPELRLVLLDFMSYIVQNPGKRVNWAILLRGTEGCGKSFFRRLMEAMLGPHNVMLVSTDSLEDKFNTWTANNLCVVVEELHVKKNLGRTVFNRLKMFITENRIPVRGMHKEIAHGRNFASYLMFTNDAASIPVNPTDRRFCVIDSPLSSPQALKEAGMDSDYFRRLWRVIERYPGGLLHFFSSRTISPGFDPIGAAPKTAYHERLVEDTEGDHLAVLRAAIKERSTWLISPSAVCVAAFRDLLREEGLGSGRATVGAALSRAGYATAVQCSLPAEFAPVGVDPRQVTFRVPVESIAKGESVIAATRRVVAALVDARNLLG